MQHRATPGRHRRTEALHSHRASRRPARRLVSPSLTPGAAAPEPAARLSAAAADPAALLPTADPAALLPTAAAAADLTPAVPAAAPGQVSIPPAADPTSALPADAVSSVDMPVTGTSVSAGLPTTVVFLTADAPAGSSPAAPVLAAGTLAALASADAPVPVLPVRVSTGPRHRAPTKPLAPALLGERGRHAVMTAALVAGVGVAGLSSAAASAGPARGAVTEQAPALAAHLPSATASTPVAGLSALTAMDTAAAAAAATTAGDADPAAGRFGAAAGGSTTTRIATGPGAAIDLTASTPIAGAKLGGMRSARKERPVPVVPVAQWVHPMPEGSVTSCFGPRWGRLHAGVDLAAASGTPIRAAGAGTVVRAGSADGYGLAVLIDHGNGYLTHYGHMSALGVTAGQRVTVGQEIGKEGSTGHSTGPHLHFEVHEGSYKNPVEPTAWMLAHGVDIGGCAAGKAAHKH